MSRRSSQLSASWPVLWYQHNEAASGCNHTDCPGRAAEVEPKKDDVIKQILLIDYFHGICHTYFLTPTIWLVYLNVEGDVLSLDIKFSMFCSLFVPKSLQGKCMKNVKEMMSLKRHLANNNQNLSHIKHEIRVDYCTKQVLTILVITSKAVCSILLESSCTPAILNMLPTALEALICGSFRSTEVTTRQ